MIDECTDCHRSPLSGSHGPGVCIGPAVPCPAMYEPGRAPREAALSALLSQHPEECAAVIAQIAIGWHGAWTCDMYLNDAARSLLPRVIVALGIAGIVTVTIDGCEPMSSVDRYAIAHQGALPWLRARLSVTTPPLDRISAAFDQLAAINVIADGLDELTRDAVEQARLRLFVALEETAHAKRGIPEYGEDEVREWGTVK